jgi:maltose phosphorylase
MEYTVESLKYVKVNAPTRFNEIVSKTSFSDSETQQWTEIVQKMYFPFDENRQIFLQQDGFLDKVLRPASEIPADQRPIHKHWSWDRILRSCFIKQADVLQGFYVFEDRFDADTIRRHFDFYEPMTVHESSLSSCVHSILAAKIGDKERAYQFYLNASRLDLDDYNNDTDDGLHITSMGGTWMTIVYGFAGMRVKNDRLSFNPFIPEQWKSLTFRIRFRENLLLIKIDHEQIQISNLSHVSANVVIFDKPFTILPENTIQTALSKGNL